jgi:hypothetical protein
LEVCMAPKKVDEIKSFLVSYMTNRSEIRKRQRTNTTSQTKKKQKQQCYTKGDCVNYTVLLTMIKYSTVQATFAAKAKQSHWAAMFSTCSYVGG